MSIKFAPTSTNDSEHLLAAYSNSQRLSGKPVSVTLWVYFDSVPTGGDTWTVWWLGQKGASGNYLALEAVANGSSITLRTRLVGQSTLGPVTKTGVATGAWHCISVVVQAGQGQGSTMVTLYVDDDTSAPSTSGTVSGITYSSWDSFALAANLANGVDDVGRFLAEQIAIWSTALGQYDTPTMFSERKPPWDMSPFPDFSYWVAAGHSRAGIRVDRGRTWTLDGGELYNQSTSDPEYPLPQLSPPPEAVEPTWRAATPVFLYANTATLTPVDRSPPKHPSRLQPSFVFNNGPTPSGDDDPPIPGADIRQLAYWHDPNMSAYSGADYSGSNQIRPPYLARQFPEYPPEGDMSQVARRLADWLEVQNFQAGTGVGPDNNYAGVIWLRGIGQSATNEIKEDGEPTRYVIHARNDDVVREVGGQTRTYAATGGRIPLEEHPLDWVLSGNRPEILAPWACWYRQNGSELVEEYMDHFWIALKQELDDRGLCYPLRAHWDYEGWPREGDQLRYDVIGENQLAQIGCWPDVAGDGRYTTEDLLNYSGSNISSLIGSVTYNANAGFFDTSNYAFYSWWNGYSVMIRMEAVAESIMSTLQTHFPFCLWSNYRAFVADNPNFKFPEGLATPIERWFNTPSKADNPDLVPQAHYSAPVLYSIDTQLNNLRGDFGERIGYTISEVVRDFNIMRVDAVANAIDPLPLVPHIEDVGRSFYKDTTTLSGGIRVLYDYVLTVEDSKALLSHLWRRGCNEYQMFAFNTLYETYADKIAVCQWLRDWVHSIPQARQDRVGRVSRLGRRGM